jgi:hypothetical protein
VEISAGLNAAHLDCRCVRDVEWRSTGRHERVKVLLKVDQGSEERLF